MSDAVSVLNGVANGTGLFFAPVGTASPTDADTALPAEWFGIGYIKEDEAPNWSQEITTVPVRAWQSATSIKRRITSRELSLGFTMIEASPMTLALYFSEDEPTPTDDEFSLALSSTPTVKEYACVLQVKDGDAYLRIALDKVSLESTGTLNTQRDEPIALPVVLAALDNGAGLGEIFVKNPGAAWVATP